MTEFPALFPSGQQTLSVDFGAEMAVGETIVSPSVVATVYSGTDASPSARIVGSASSSGTVVSQKVLAPASAGNIYQLLFTITTSASQVLKRSGLLAIVPAS